MIKSFRLKFGRAPHLQPEVIDGASVTIFVGPNNSGKSKALHELHNLCVSGEHHPSHVILQSVTYEDSTEEEARSVLKQVTLQPKVGDGLAQGQIWVGNGRGRNQVPADRFLRALKNPSDAPQLFGNYYLAYNMILLDGASRISLAKPQPVADLQGPQSSTMAALFVDDKKRAEACRLVHEAFGSYLVIDPTKLGSLRLRLSERPPHDNSEEQALDERARLFHANASLVEDLSDGVKAFTGIICEIIAGDPLIVSIDEPEAFLHPSLAYTLGKDIAVSAKKANKRIFASTHSPNFLMGCIQSGIEVNIIRLTYRGGIATARAMRNKELLPLMRNPLLRSTGALAGLFYEFVVVTESDSDRAFYQEINERLLRVGRGIPNCLFLNAQNKQTVHLIVQPLRKLGIPAAGIFDIDILKDGGTNWTNFLKAGFMPDMEHQPLGAIRHALKEKIEATGRNMKTDGGIFILENSELEAARNLVNRLSQYGLFVVPHGELEFWLRGLGAHNHGTQWLINIFEKMGEDPDSQGYVHPGVGDVWEFLEGLKSWLLNPSRRGIPD